MVVLNVATEPEWGFRCHGKRIYNAAFPPVQNVRMFIRRRHKSSARYENETRAMGLENSQSIQIGQHTNEVIYPND